MRRILLSLLIFLGAHLVQAQDLPRVTLRDLSGKPVMTDSLLRAGKPIILSFFGTWCKPCLRELDAISEVYADWQAETGVTLYAICINEGADVQKIRPVVHAHAWDYVVLSDANADLKRAMNVSAVPALFVLDGSGKLLHRRSGYVEGSESEIIRVLRQAANRSPQP